MACSKIFSGDLPELISEILQYFRNDFTMLHSCILVNRIWCRLAIPLLWEDPFSIPTQNYRFIEIYLYNLNDDDKAKLIEYGIHNTLFPSSTLFNYPSFIKCLNTYKVFISIENWVSIPHYFTFLKNSVKLIYESLFKIFIESKANLHTFEISDYGFNSIQNLRQISFNNLPLYHSLYSLSPLKSFNCSNTLKTIIFYKANFKNIVILNEVFEQLNVLESIHILYCISLNSDFIQQIINMTKPFKLKSLFVDEIFQFEIFQLLLQHSGSYLENIGFESSISNELKQQLFELIKKYCKRIKFFDLLGFDNQNIHSAFDLIKSVEQNLNYLSINFCTFHNFDLNQLSDDIELSSTVLLNLGQILPSKLEYLSLSLMINISELEVFLKNSKNTFIKKLLIRNKMQEDSEDILSYIREYIMKEKRVRYLAIEEIFPKKRRDLSFLKGEVKIFGSYGIKVQNYDDLNLDCYNFIKEIY